MACLDGELPADRAAVIRAHLAVCDRCQRVSDELTGVSRSLAQWRIEKTPDTLRAPSLFNGGRASARWSWPSFGVIWTRPVMVRAFAGAAAVLLVGVVLAQLPRRYSTARPGVSASPSVRAYNLPRKGVAGQAAADVPESLSLGHASQPPAQPTRSAIVTRTARLRLVATNFDTARPEVDRILRDLSGFVGEIVVTGGRGTPRSLTATLRVPSDRLDAALTALKGLGQVVQESQAGEDVTDQVVDLDARLTNNRNTETRLIDLLQKRTGALDDVLAAEREIARVREEIERLDAQRKHIQDRVTYATLSLEVLEERKADLDLGTQSLSTRFRNAIVEGFTAALDSLLEVTLFLVRVGPALMLWAVVLFWPARRFYRRLVVRRS
jgi:hypothetical protein